MRTNVLLLSAAAVTLLCSAPPAWATPDKADDRPDAQRVIPALPTGLQINRTDSGTLVKWNPSTTENGTGKKLPDTAVVRYTVKEKYTCRPLSRQIAETQWFDARTVANTTPPAIGLYSVGATCDNDGEAAYATKMSDAQAFVIGHWEVPWIYTPDADCKWYFTRIDANSDYKQWDRNAAKPASEKNNRNVLSLMTSAGADDWLITAPIYLKAGKAYRFRVNAFENVADKSEKIEIKAGMGNTVADMVFDLLPVTTVSSFQELTPLVCGAIVPADGYYNIGIHAVSDSGSGQLVIWDMALDDGSDLGAPDAPAAQFNPLRDGSCNVEIGFITPSKDVLGRDIADLAGWRVYRDTLLVASGEETEMGKTITVTDQNVPSGTYLYKIMCYNSIGEGAGTFETVIAGDRPLSKPLQLKAARIEGTDQVKLSWQAQTKDLDGNFINLKNISFNLYECTGILPTLVAENIPCSGSITTEYTHTVENAEAKKILNFQVSAVNGAGESELSCMNVNAVAFNQDAPLAMPWSESFSQARPDNAFGLDMPRADAYGQLYTFAVNMPTMDDDEGLLYFKDPYRCTAGNSGVVTPFITISGENPVARVHMLLRQLPTQNTMGISVNDGTGWVSLGSIPLDQGKTTEDIDKWIPFEASLKDYVGKTVQVRFDTNLDYFGSTYADNLQICENVANNVGILRLEANDGVNSVAPGGKVRVKVYLRNFGSTAQTKPTTVNLLRGDVKVGSARISSLASGMPAMVSFTDTVPADLAGKTLEYTAQYVNVSDQYAADNTRGLTLNVEENPYPAASDLAGSLSDGNVVSLTWSAPDYDNVPVRQAFEDFEDYPGNQHNDIIGWTMYDIDGANQHKFINSTMPYRGPEAWWIFDSNYADFNPGKAVRIYSYRDGYRSLCTNMSTADWADDWAVFPELSGDAQTISFLASEMNYPDQSDAVHYYTSSTGNAIEDFTDQGLVPYVYESRSSNFGFNQRTAYRQISLPVPEGTKYFALRRFSYNYNSAPTIYMIDNVRYTPARTEPLTFLGYNVYRDGEKINDQPVTEPSFTQKGQPLGQHDYAVTALYNEGESSLSQSVTLDITSALSSLTQSAVEIARFAPDGRRVDASYRGIVLVKYSDGTVLKLTNRK